MATIMLLGSFTDAGGWMIVNGKLVHVEGWGVELLEEVRLAAEIVQSASALKTRGLAESVTERLGAFIDREVGGYAQGEHVVALA